MKGDASMKIEQRHNPEDNTIDLVVKGSRSAKGFIIAKFYPKPWYSKPERSVIINAFITTVLENFKELV